MNFSTRTKHGLFLLAVISLVCFWAGSVFAAGAEGGGGEQGFRWVPFLAPFHNVILHLPIGFVLLACLIEAATFRRPSDEGRFIIGLIHISSALAMVATVALGLARAAEGGYEENTLSQHKIWGIVAGVLTVVVLVVHHLAFKKDGGHSALLNVYRVFLVANLGVISVAGHQGGNLTHGSDYLVANAPEFVKRLLGEGGDDEAGQSGGGAVETAETDDRMAHFKNRVWPALKEKCLKCHGEQKQKGGYTLTDKKIAFEGGDSEIAAIVPGNPAKSLLVESIMLPSDDDYVMPPDGKEPMTDAEIVAVVKWVRDGAVWPDTLPE